MGHDSRKTIEKVRPILQAMERSIDAARNRRVADKDTGPATPIAPVSPTLALPRSTGFVPRSAPTQPAMADEPDSPPRLKARPKRSNAGAPGMSYTGIEADYQSRAG